MKEQTIRKLVELVEKADIESLTVRSWWSRVHIVKRAANGGNGGSLKASEITLPREALQPTLPPVQAQAPQSESQPAAVSAETVLPPKSATAKEITSPMVGTFYISPEPDAPPFAGVGQKVGKGQTLCIIEAMKLMNEIEAEYDCTIVERLVENAEAVEYGTPIFLVEPA